MPSSQGKTPTPGPAHAGNAAQSTADPPAAAAAKPQPQRRRHESPAKPAAPAAKPPAAEEKREPECKPTPYRGVVLRTTDQMYLSLVQVPVTVGVKKRVRRGGGQCSAVPRGSPVLPAVRPASAARVWCAARALLSCAQVEMQWLLLGEFKDVQDAVTQRDTVSIALSGLNSQTVKPPMSYACVRRRGGGLGTRCLQAVCATA